MLTHNHDHHHDQDGDHSAPRRQRLRRYSAAVPAYCLDEHGRLIDELIRFAFDTLGVYRLDLRVYEAE